MDRSANPAVGVPQIFVDDGMIARKEGIARRIHGCDKLSHPVLIGEEPWETSDVDRRAYIYGTVFRDTRGDGFRMWYMRNTNRVLYATSDDGVNWHRPHLNLVKVDGSGDNNILPIGFHSPSVVYNPRETDPEKRYKMLGYAKLPSGPGYYAACSSDGLGWTLYEKNPILPGGDTCTLSLDPDTGEYLAFHKLYDDCRGHWRRLVYLSVSKDMQNWSEPVLAMAPDEIDDRQTQTEGGLFSEFYNMSAFPYGGQWLGLVTHFRYSGPPQVKGPEQSGDDGPIDVQLVHSRDGCSWARCEDRTPVIPNGPSAYDAGCILGVTNQPVFVGDEMWIYYTGITTTHGGYLPKKECGIARATWRLDGWVSLDAGPEGGTVETVAMRPSGNGLIVNTMAEDGALEVEVTDETGMPLPGYRFEDCEPIRGNDVRQAVRWQNRSTLPAERPIRLRFTLKNASIYSYLFE